MNNNINYSQVKEGIEEIGRTDVEFVINSLGAEVVKSQIDEGVTFGELKEAIENHDEDIVKAAISIGIAIADIDEAYSGHFTSDRAFAEDMAEQLGSVPDNVAWPMTCIDWNLAAKELMYDYSEENGYYFRNI